MKGRKPQYRFLIHCDIHQIREGFEASIKKMPVPIETCYADLLQEGIMSELKYNPHLIIVLQHESDSDYMLPVKIKLFARDYPLLVISPSIPDNYYHLLRLIGVDHIVQLPTDDEAICNTILSIFKGGYHRKP